MDKPKIKPVLQERVIQERRIEEEQKQLQKKYNLPAKKYIEIRKEHWLTSVRKIIARLIRMAAVCILFSLAFVGTVALFYPESRIDLLYVYNDTLRQLQDFMPVLEPIIRKVGTIS